MEMNNPNDNTNNDNNNNNNVVDDDNNDDDDDDNDNDGNIKNKNTAAIMTTKESLDSASSPPPPPPSSSSSQLPQKEKGEEEDCDDAQLQVIVGREGNGNENMDEIPESSLPLAAAAAAAAETAASRQESMEIVSKNKNNDNNSNNNNNTNNNNNINSSQSQSNSITIISYRQHLWDVSKISNWIIISEFFQNTLPVVDIAFIGRLPDSKDDLAAAALATVWFNLWNFTMIGFLSAIDTLLAQSYGAKDYIAFCTWTGTTLVIVWMVTIVIAIILALCGPIMKLVGQEEHLSEEAANFMYRLLPGLLPYYTFKVFIKYLQTQDILLPGVWIGLFANGLNILFNWLLIYEWNMGIDGAPWATTLTRFVECFMIVFYLQFMFQWGKKQQPQHQQQNDNDKNENNDDNTNNQKDATTTTTMTTTTKLNKNNDDADTVLEPISITNGPDTTTATTTTHINSSLNTTTTTNTATTNTTTISTISSMHPIFCISNLKNQTMLRPFWKLSISGALSLTAEAWSFEITTILAGLLGTTALDAHIIAFTIASFLFLSFPFAIGLAASIRVGQLIATTTTTAATTNNDTTTTTNDTTNHDTTNHTTNDATNDTTTTTTKTTTPVDARKIKSSKSENDEDEDEDGIGTTSQPPLLSLATTSTITTTTNVSTTATAASAAAAAINARRSGVISLFLAIIVQALIIVLLVLTDEWLGHLFSSDEEVAHLVTVLIPICCIFMMGDAIQATIGGILRGLGRQKFVLCLNILGFWILGVPMGSLLTFVIFLDADDSNNNNNENENENNDNDDYLAVQGLWWGMVIGVYTACMIGILFLKFRVDWNGETQKASKRVLAASTSFKEQRNQKQKQQKEKEKEKQKQNQNQRQSL